ncbi:MAG TPA: hypothetical protein VGL77_10780 [Armatimonadota bacterium]|jgi:hypothetical protein
MADKPKTLSGGIWRFIGSAIFGGFLSLLLLFVFLHLGIVRDLDDWWLRGVLHALWILPVCWGILGIFWYDAMLDMARDIVEWFVRALGSRY